ncbi:hypothetical protein BSKO_08052 [Bryopsis sp. KO-2023]|nr:hypothetical protein BSKO_08052 [Bryopsis sp. KO-2023]
MFRCASALRELKPRLGILGSFRLESTDVAAEEVVRVACVLERGPLLKALLPDWEAEFKTWAEKIRAKRSKQLPVEFIEGKRSVGDEEGDEEEAKKMASWRPNPRVSAADKAGDTKSLMRCLDAHLFLIVKSKSGWGFPETENLQTETFRQTAERVLEETMGSSFQTYFLGNCPFGHIKAENGKGPNLFFHRAKLVVGTPSLKSQGVMDYAWVSKEELPKYLKDEKVQKLTKGMLPNVHPKVVRHFW